MVLLLVRGRGGRNPFINRAGPSGPTGPRYFKRLVRVVYIMMVLHCNKR